MTKLLEKDTKFKWSSQCEETFLTLEKLLTTASVLAQPDIEKSFDVYYDASARELEVYSCKTVVQLPMVHDCSDAMKITISPMT
jgi:hypothetical protein